MADGWNARLRRRAGELRSEVTALRVAAGDPRTPLAPKLLALAVIAYALSPIDLIPDFIPVLGYLDDLLLVPAGLALAVRLVPAEVMEDARRAARETPPPGTLGRVGAVAVVVLWLLAIAWLAAWLTGLE